MAAFGCRDYMGGVFRSVRCGVSGLNIVCQPAPVLFSLYIMEARPPHPAPILSGPLPLADGFLQQFPLLFLSVFSASSPEPQRAAVPPSFQEEPFPSLKLPTSLYSISLLPFMIDLPCPLPFDLQGTFLWPLPAPAHRSGLILSYSGF